MIKMPVSKKRALNGSRSIFVNFGRLALSIPCTSSRNFRTSDTHVLLLNVVMKLRLRLILFIDKRQ